MVTDWTTFDDRHCSVLAAFDLAFALGDLVAGGDDAVEVGA
jgi:hypothetical protein